MLRVHESEGMGEGGKRLGWGCSSCHHVSSLDVGVAVGLVLWRKVERRWWLPKNHLATFTHVTSVERR